jgi:hypothetical protein
MYGTPSFDSRPAFAARALDVRHAELRFAASVRRPRSRCTARRASIRGQRSPPALSMYGTPSFDSRPVFAAREPALSMYRAPSFDSRPSVRRSGTCALDVRHAELRFAASVRRNLALQNASTAAPPVSEYEYEYEYEFHQRQSSTSLQAA